MPCTVSALGARVCWDAEVGSLRDCRTLRGVSQLRSARAAQGAMIAVLEGGLRLPGVKTLANKKEAAEEPSP